MHDTNLDGEVNVLGPWSDAKHRRSNASAEGEHRECDQNYGFDVQRFFRAIQLRPPNGRFFCDTGLDIRKRLELRESLTPQQGSNNKRKCTEGLSAKNHVVGYGELRVDSNEEMSECHLSSF